MGLYDEQIQTRIKNDKDAFDESFFRLASVVTGNERGVDTFYSDREKSQNAIEEILKYFHIVPAPLPDKVDTVDEQLEFLLRPSCIMRRRVELTGNWYMDGFGPLLAETKEGEVIALLPRKTGGYAFLDRGSGKTVRVKRSNAGQIGAGALCFYKPLPLRRLGVADLIKFMVHSLAPSDIGMMCVLTLAVTFLGMITPYGTRLLFNIVVPSGDVFQLLSVAVLLLGTVVAATLINMTGEVLTTRVGGRVDVCVQSAIMARIIALPVAFFRDYSAGDLAQRLQNANQMCGAMMGMLIKVGLTSIFALLFIGQIAVFAPSLALPALAVIAAGVSFTAYSALMAMKSAKLEKREQTRVSGLVFQLFSGIQKIKLAGCEQRAFAKWANAYERMAKRKFNPPVIVRVSPVISAAIAAAGAVFIFYAAGKSHVAVSDYMAFASAYGMVSAAMVLMSSVALMLSAAKPLLDLARPVLEAEPEVSAGKRVINGLSGNIEINNVSFRYSEDMPYILEDISLKVRAGQYVAIVGKSGCGKSTLIRLLLGFEKAEKGAVYYDGKDINSIDAKSLRRQIGCVIQNGKLMSDSIFSNIAVSAPLLGMDGAWEAAALAGVADDIRAMPMGMHTIVAEGGGGLSGGQRQRLMIARAIAPKPKILMLDEATSALDNITQKHVSESLDALKCTRIVIAHRLSTIRQCNRIIFLDKGKIVEDGTYDELIALGGQFAKLVERQMLEPA